MLTFRHVRSRRACARKLVLENLLGVASAPLVTAAETGLAPHRVVRLADKLAGSHSPGEAPSWGSASLFNLRPAIPRGGRALLSGRG